jgi:hypothetical protein
MEPGAQGAAGLGPSLRGIDNSLGDTQMPIILWLLGVPLTVVILLMLFHVI